MLEVIVEEHYAIRRILYVSSENEWNTDVF